jgi:hypothetical protein
MFIGEWRIMRRRRMIARLQRSGVDVKAYGDWGNPEFWGDNRTRLVNRTRIFLNIQRFPGEFSGARMILGMSNKALVISEPMYDPSPYVPGRHFVSATVDEMPKVIRYYLENATERERIAAEGHRFVTQELTMERSIQTLVRLVSEHLVDVSPRLEERQAVTIPPAEEGGKSGNSLDYL